MRHLLVRLAFIGFLCRALVPVGFMPAPLADGGPIRLCHGGAAGALVAALLEQGAAPAAAEQEALPHSHHSHAGDHLAQHDGQEQNAVHEGWERCPVGAAFALAVLASDVALPLLPLEHVLAASDSKSSVPRPLAAPYQARAPPRV